MRIISGALKGHQFNSPHARHTHPMSEKARGALFNILGDINGLTFLDAFTGSGALALEAASRGAASITAIEKDHAAYSVLNKNARRLHLNKVVKSVRANAGGWSIHNMERVFDVVILAPPYDDLHENLLHTLAIRHVTNNGVLVLDWPAKLSPPDFKNFKLATEKKYGDAQLLFYKKFGGRERT